MNFKILYNSLVYTAIFLFIQACSVQKYIPEDELLFDGYEVTVASENDSLPIKNKPQLKAALENVLLPEANGKFLGMYPGLFYFYKVQDSTPGFFNKFMFRQIGEKPIYKSDVESYEIEQLLQNRLNNRGFFYSTTTSNFIDDEENKKSKVDYNVTVKQPYEMETYQIDSLPSPLENEIKEIVAESKFEKGSRFDLSNMKLERERIDGELKKRGYYNFNPGFLIFEADTNQYKNKRFDLFLTLKKDVPKKAVIPYMVTTINVYTNYDLKKDSLELETVEFNNKNYISDELFFKPKYLDPFITLKANSLYDPVASKNTARRLATIGSYKFVNIQYREIEDEDQDSIGKLEASIYLSPLNKRAIRAELQAVTKSNNFAGPALGLTFTNRNLFKGGETLNISATGGYEIQVSGGDQSGLTSIELGLGAELFFPRVIFPWKINTDFFEYAIPKTKTGISLDYLSRSQLYTLLSGTATFGYVWDANRYVTHQINPISVNYTKLSNTTEEFQMILDQNTFLQRSFEQQFISGLTYSFTYNGMVDTNKTNQFYLNATLDVAGNSISLFAKEETPGEPKTFLGTEYAQFAKADVDLRYHFNFGNDQKIATRLFAGYGYAYGNSEVLPFIKQYYSGGPYSVRAFNIRSLGPGTFDGTINGDDTFFDQSGNIRLEANAEYRFPIFGFVKGAIFADAGNIWNSIDNPDIPNDTFSSSFLSELGMGAGFGVRVDVQGFVIRLDLAAPFHDPSLPKGERFDFQIDKPVLNFAIGYPF
ncbi:membrane protein [Patiriisocius marinistellae]|uniref:Membrane protein n=1 Tax=Patiriisocius marinistellae TaxID=2494560 RepID=A0A5J4FYS7_9FLAO|nr:BamA/TamA family outer membrane protein [Patiriisocius marinistellae]GEQ87223.1 membrane protein [Patiriisocius marinistellae]